MEALQQVFGIMILLALFVGIPIARRQLRISRIRAEWRARGQGFAEGRRLATSATAPIAPVVHNWNWRGVGAGVLVALALAWVWLMMAHTHHLGDVATAGDETTAVSSSRTPKRSDTSRAKRPATTSVATSSDWKPTRTDCKRLSDDYDYRRSLEATLSRHELTERGLTCAFYLAANPTPRK